MPKGYIIGRVDVTEPEAYKAYVAGNGPAIAKFGGRFLVRGGDFEAPEGTSRARNVVIEFPSFKAARDCYNSPEYQAVMVHRVSAAVSDILIIEGYDGPQPGDD